VDGIVGSVAVTVRSQHERERRWAGASPRG
jgi:hypothetical protein